jgi:hypothetical protein
MANLKDDIRELFVKPELKFFMKIFIKEGDKERFYKKIPWTCNNNTTVLSVENAEKLIEFLTSEET